MNWIWPIGAVLGRDFRIALSYRLSVLITLASTLFGVALWYFFSLAVTPTRGDWATGGYFGYLVTGTALMGFVNVSLHSFGRKIREDQMTGTLEVLFGSPAPATLVLFSSLLWDLLIQSLQVAFTVAAALLFGLRLHVGSVPALILLLALTVLVFAAFGLLAASLLLVFQRGEPVTPFVGAFFALLGGVFFPPSVLPGPLSFLAGLIPLPYALNALRGLLLDGWSFSDALPDLQILLLFAALLLPAAMMLFPLCLRTARRYGLLTTY